MAGPAAAIALHAYAESEELGSLFPVPAPLQDHFNAYREEVWRKYQPEDARYLENHRGHLMFLRPEEERFVTGGLIKGMTLTGTSAELVEQLQGLKAAGYKQFCVHARNGREIEMMEDWAEVIAKV